MKASGINLWQPAHLNLEIDKFLSTVFYAALESSLPVALWRCPKSDSKHVIADISGEAQKTEISFTKMSPGFCLAPFNGEPEPPIFISADFYANEEGCFWRAETNDALLALNKKQFETALQIQNSNGHKPPNWYVTTENIRRRSPNKKEYCQLVRKAIGSIKQGQHKKIVLSRVVEVGVGNDFFPLALFNQLCGAYPTAFVSLVAIPGVGTWIGATPELLLNLENDELVTVALAGTRPAGPESLGWTEKEIVEQSIVSDFIRSAFQATGVSDFVEGKTKTTQIGNLLHLQTKFRVQGVSGRKTGTVEKFLKNIHPTPAICGVPQKSSCDFITSQEFHDRQFYAGFLGPINIRNQSRLFVNLRCLQMLEKSALVYAGGGITIDSEPENEWEETELKLEALLKFLRTTELAKNAQQAEMI